MIDHSPESASIPANAQRVLVLQGGGALGSYQAGAYQVAIGIAVSQEELSYNRRLQR